MCERETLKASKMHVLFFISSILIIFYGSPVSSDHICLQTVWTTKLVTSVKQFSANYFETYQYQCERYVQKNVCIGYRKSRKTFTRTVTKIVRFPQQKQHCCHGWSRYSSQHGCLKPVCNHVCQNGGKCARPFTCQCAEGWTGPSCEQDIDECEVNNGGCDLTCVNYDGGFECELYLEGETSENEVPRPSNAEWNIMNVRVYALEQLVIQLARNIQAIVGSNTKLTNSVAVANAATS